MATLNRYQNDTRDVQTWNDPITGEEVRVGPHQTVLAEEGSAIARSRFTRLVKRDVSRESELDAQSVPAESESADNTVTAKNGTGGQSGAPSNETKQASKPPANKK